MLLLRLIAALALTALVVAVTGLVASPASATQTPAFYEVEYTVDVDITAQWSITTKDMDDYPKREFGGDIKVRVRGQVDNVLFRDGKLLTGQPTGFLTIDEPTGSGYTEVTTWDPFKKQEQLTKGICDVASPGIGTESFVRRAAAQPNPNAERLSWRLAAILPIGFVCEGDEPDAGADVLYNGSSFPNGIMDTTFELPLEAIGMGKIIQNISPTDSQRSPEFCPGKDLPYTEGCAFNWSAKLTFNKVDEWQYMGEAPVDPRADAVIKAVEQYGKEPIDPRADAVIKAVEQYQVEIDPRADAVSKAVEQYGKELRFKAVCQTGCTGTAEILPRAGRKPLSAHASAKRKALAKLKFKVPAGKPREIRVTLPRKARAALKRAGGGTVKLTLRPKTGRPKTKTLALKTVRR